MNKTFEELLIATPECNDFRRLGDDTWIAYSTRMDSDHLAIRCNAPTIREALEGLIEKLK